VPAHAVRSVQPASASAARRVIPADGTASGERIPGRLVRRQAFGVMLEVPVTGFTVTVPRVKSRFQASPTL
jgi:hypothetical protein